MSPKRVAPGDPLAGSFGFDPADAAAHFLVHIPSSSQQSIEVSEHLSWDPGRVGQNIHHNADRTDGQVRSRLVRPKWDRIAEAVRAEFNSRLKSQGRLPGRWSTGYNPLARSLGKELCVLTWAIEDADPALTPAALANWQGLTPEERWWLYTMTAAATGNYVTGRNVGWRKAVRYALTENPAGIRAAEDRVVPEFFRLAEAVPTPSRPSRGSSTQRSRSSVATGAEATADDAPGRRSRRNSVRATRPPQ